MVGSRSLHRPIAVSLINFKVLDELRIIGKSAQSKLRIHNGPHNLTDLNYGPSVTRKAQRVVLANN